MTIVVYLPGCQLDWKLELIFYYSIAQSYLHLSSQIELDIVAFSIFVAKYFILWIILIWISAAG
jgi:hypothetical protein